MKAIVLSYDKYHPLADNMIQSYEEIWPSNPFVFRVPYQKYPKYLKDKYREKIELWETPSEIKPTVLSLLSDLRDDDWIYWCIDDKYLVTIDEPAANNIYKWITKITDEKVDGVLFCRCRGLLDDRNLREGTAVTTPTGEELIERVNYYQFWIHQFMRVRILRNLFSEFPDKHFTAIEMDAFTGQRAELPVKEFNSDEKMYVSVRNMVRFGESTTGGKLTRNCRNSLLHRGMGVPSSFQMGHDRMYMGKLHIKTILKAFINNLRKKYI